MPTSRPRRPLPPPPESFGDVLRLWPSMVVLAEDIEVPYFTVSSWNHRGFIPERYWQLLADAAYERRIRHVTYKRLHAIANRDPATDSTVKAPHAARR